MGWSVPEVPARAPAARWSPWVCLLIILLGVSVGLVWGIFMAPEGGVLSGAWLPLTSGMLAVVAAAITLYLLWWEVQALIAWYWNSWRLNMLTAWQRQAQQHLCVISQVVLTPDEECALRMIGLAGQDESAHQSTTLFPDDILNPGISRFEALCRALILQITSSLPSWYPAGRINVVIQTQDDPDVSAELQQLRITALWKDLGLPWRATVEILPAVFPFEYWNKQLQELDHPMLVMALHYRQPGETQTEFASAMLFSPPSLLPSAMRHDALKLFRAMPLETARFKTELESLRDMMQQPVNAIQLLWFSGLTAPQRKRLGTVIHDMPLSLSRSAPEGGIIDFDKSHNGYRHLASWLMAAVAAETASYDMGGHWLLWADDEQAWAMVAGNQKIATPQPSEAVPVAPFPAGGILLAVVLNTLWLWFFASVYPDRLFSWWGVFCALLISGISLPGIVLALRKTVARFLLPAFFRAADKQEKDVE